MRTESARGRGRMLRIGSLLRPMSRLLALLVALPMAAAAAAQPAPETPARLARIRPAFADLDRIVQAFAAREHVPGVAYGVVLDGQVVHVGVAGVRHVATGAPVERNSVFRIASMTKSFAAAAILQLRDAGRLSLDAPAERYVPELAALRYPTSDAPRITVRHLLTHSAGFPEDNPWGDQQLALSDEAMGRMIEAGIPFSTAPGTAYEYSNYGFALLGRIVANVSGQSFADYLRARVLVPLGMTHTTLEAADVPPARLAIGYRYEDQRWTPEPALPDGAFGPMGGLLTTVDDLSRWVAFLLDAFPARDGADSPVLSRASRREMQQMARYGALDAARSPETGAVVATASGYGYGLRVSQTCAFRHVVAHTGGLPGYGSQMRWLPDVGIGLVAMGNRTYTRWNAPFDALLARLAQTGVLVPRPAVPAPVLLRRMDEVTRLVQRWDEGLLGQTAAMNLALDQSFERRRIQIERLVREAGGACRPEGDLVAENALRGSWRMRCGTSDLKVTITLAPDPEARVQHLDVAPFPRNEPLAPPRPCR